MNAVEVQKGRVSPTCAKDKRIACCNKKKSRETPLLPQEIIFNILVRLPADILYNISKCICQQWYNIIRNPLFIKEHLRRCVTAFFIQYNQLPYTASCVEMGKGNIVEKEVSFQFPRTVFGNSDGEVSYPSFETVLSSCDGLMLCRDLKNGTILHVTNPITKQRVTLPPIAWCDRGSKFSLACARSTGEYKVVSAYEELRNLNAPQLFDIAIHCVIVTVGKDHEWKVIRTRHICDPAGVLLTGCSLSAGGFVYWAHSSIPFFITLDMEDEMFSEFPAPKVCPRDTEDIDIDIRYIKIGYTISCFVRHMHFFVWDVWVLSGPKCGEWRKLYKIDLQGQRHLYAWLFYESSSSSRPIRYASFRPVAWVNNGEVVVFVIFSNPSTYIAHSPYIAHNVKTGETFTFGCYKLSYKDYFHYFWDTYVSSLVSLPPTKHTA